MNDTVLIQGLLKPAAYSHETDSIRLVETHCAWVILTGPYAYKLKKPVNFGFLDYSTLEKRHYYCKEELRLNRRFAPDIYLDVVTINGTPAHPQLAGNGETLDYAVRMRQFPDNGLLSQLAVRHALHASHIDQLVQTVSTFHCNAPRTTAADNFGKPAGIHHWVRENFQHMQPLLTSADNPDAVEQLRQWCEHEYTELSGLLQTRKDTGAVRECHGDLHLGNITLIEDRVTPFDCIEFNPELRWIDVISEIAFLLMDLDDHGQPGFANRFLNGYLQATGDYTGLAVLRYYLVYRAMVRAKVAVLRRQQTGDAPYVQQQAGAELQQYVNLALGYITRGRTVLVITRGLSGSGKSTVARNLCARSGMIQLRSDVERKRLAGLATTEDSHSDTGTGLYTADRTANTYQQLGTLAKTVLAAGYSVIVDATFLKREQRSFFRSLANETGTPFLILECSAEDSELERRIQTRHASQSDPSEATLAVLQAQQQSDEPLEEDELKYLLHINTQHPSDEVVWSAFRDLTQA